MQFLERLEVVCRIRKTAHLQSTSNLQCANQLLFTSFFVLKLVYKKCNLQNCFLSQCTEHSTFTFTFEPSQLKFTLNQVELELEPSMLISYPQLQLLEQIHFRFTSRFFSQSSQHPPNGPFGEILFHLSPVPEISSLQPEPGKRPAPGQPGTTVQ